jgi:Cu/Ag efflux pump CusA
MKRLIQWSIDHHWMIMALSVLLLLGAIWTARDMPVDVFPDLTAPTVTILTEGRGMAPDEMESLVTFPLESAINGASGVRRVRSATALGVAVVWVEFEWGTDIFLARQIVAEKLASSAAHCRPRSSGRCWRRYRQSWERSSFSRSRPTRTIR